MCLCLKEKNTRKSRFILPFHMLWYAFEGFYRASQIARPLSGAELFCSPRERRFSDRDVCKYYICGLCPYEEFRRTKNDFGDCPKVHDDKCRLQWEALSDEEKDRHGYERDLKRWLDQLELDLKKRKDSNNSRLKATQKPVYLAEDKAALDELSKQIEELLAKAQALGEEGDVDSAEAATAEAEELKGRRATLEREADSRSGNNITKGLVQSVCPVSGLIINDEESRLRDHHAGRNYNAWKKVHEKHSELEEIFKKRREAARTERRHSPSSDRYRDRHRYRGSRHSRRSRSRDRGVRRSRSRSREHSRYKDSPRSRTEEKKPQSGEA